MDYRSYQGQCGGPYAAARTTATPRRNSRDGRGRREDIIRLLIDGVWISVPRAYLVGEHATDGRGTLVSAGTEFGAANAGLAPATACIIYRDQASLVEHCQCVAASSAAVEGGGALAARLVGLRFTKAAKCANPPASKRAVAFGRERRRCWSCERHHGLSSQNYMRRLHADKRAVSRWRILVGVRARHRHAPSLTRRLCASSAGDVRGSCWCKSERSTSSRP